MNGWLVDLASICVISLLCSLWVGLAIVLLFSWLVFLLICKMIPVRSGGEAAPVSYIICYVVRADMITARVYTLLLFTE